MGIQMKSGRLKQQDSENAKNSMQLSLPDTYESPGAIQGADARKKNGHRGGEPQCPWQVSLLQPSKSQAGRACGAVG